MKREDCQHGMFRTYDVLPSPWNPEPGTRSGQRLSSPQVTGLFSNVPAKACNHSKFTGKCDRTQCLESHLNPVSKSKDKTKGTQKFRTSYKVVSPRLITWRRVVDRQPGLSVSWSSSMGILEHLHSVNEDDEIGHHVNDVHDDYDDGGPCGLLDDDDDDDDSMANIWSLHEKEKERGAEIEEYVDDDHNMDSNYDDDDVSYCDVGFMLDQTEEDEGWCLLREM